jgi:hypothetical protein
MKTTRELEDLIIKLQAGELTGEAQQRLQILLGMHPEYKNLLRMHEWLTRVPRLFTEPDAVEFKKLRENVMSNIRNRRLRSGIWLNWIESIRFYVQRPEIAIAALTLLVGFFLGRALPTQNEGTRGIMKQINLIARENKELSDVKNSPYRFSAIAFEEIDTQNIALSFDVSTHLEMIRPKNDPLVREVISQALLNPSPGGTELKAISVSESVLDQKVKEALVFSLQHAPMLAVRMKALQTLLRYKADPDVQEAFLQVLQEEESVQMRLQILDYFEEIQFDRNTLKAALAGMDLRNDPAVLWRAKKYLEEKN